MLPETLDVLYTVLDAFNEVGIRYFIGGSLASAYYGVTRSTLDADIVADLRIDQIEALADVLKDEFYADLGMLRSAVNNQSSFNLIHLQTIFKVDVFILKKRPFDQIQFERRISQILSSDSDKRAYITTAEDIVLAKLEWFRMGGEVSDRQWRDILGVMKVQGESLERDYLWRWAAELGVADLLKKAFQETGE
jgi:hypothetical protein